MSYKVKTGINTFDDYVATDEKSIPGTGVEYGRQETIPGKMYESH